MRSEQKQAYSLSLPVTGILYEQDAWSINKLICGVDEVGRGCLAGPVIACAVILHSHKNHPLLVDSKILTENDRLIAANWIVANSWFSFGTVSHRLIDQYNIYQATRIAMQQALTTLFTQKSFLMDRILIDAMPLVFKHQGKSIPVESFPFGEQRSISIAAASILAKVKRDTLLKSLDIIFPDYKFAKNKGYGSPEHLAAITSHGKSIIHRKSFLSKKEVRTNETKQQTSLFCGGC